MNLPNLTGTEKQIEWANEIRNRLFRATSTESIIARIQNEAAAGHVTEADIDRILGKFGELNEATIAKIIGDFFAAETSAAYWIESRHETSLAAKVCDAIFA